MPEERYGAPYLCMHRADLHSALADVLPDEIIHRGKKLVDLQQDDRKVRLSFADGTSADLALAEFVTERRLRKTA